MFACPDGCTKCIKACPTAALSGPLTMDATHCIAYLSYTPGLIPAESLRDKMGTWLYGCDICQNVCPANAKTWQGNDACFPEPWPLQDLITLIRLATLDEKTYQTKIQPRFSYLGQYDSWQWKGNAIRAMANDYRPEYEEYITMAIDDSHENVRAIAAWALAKVRREKAL